MSRWILEEENAIAEIRKNCHDEIVQQVPAFPEVVGDRRIIRFFRGNEFNIEKASRAYSSFLKWRRENNIDAIRQNIAFGTAKSLRDFPSGDKVLNICPLTVLNSNVFDKFGQPITFESYEFSLRRLLEEVPTQEFAVFVLYGMEYQSMVLEQLSDEREKEYLRSHPRPEDRKSPYGVVLRVCSIRDLRGVNMTQLGFYGRSLTSAMLQITLPNYPEMLGTAYHVNTPTVFSVFWYFVKAFIDERMLSLIKISSSHPLEALKESIDIANISKRFNGNLEQYKDQPFKFDLSKGGPLWCPPKDNASSNSHGIQIDTSIAETSVIPDIKLPVESNVLSPKTPKSTSSFTSGPRSNTRRRSRSKNTGSPGFSPLMTPKRSTSVSSPVKDETASVHSEGSSKSHNDYFVWPPNDHVEALMDYFKSQNNFLGQSISLDKWENRQGFLPIPSISMDNWDETTDRLSKDIGNAQNKAAESIDEVLEFIQTQNENLLKTSRPASERLQKILESASSSLQPDGLLDYLNPSSELDSSSLDLDDIKPRTRKSSLDGIIDFIQAQVPALPTAIQVSDLTNPFNTTNSGGSDIMSFIHSQNQSLHDITVKGQEMLHPFVSNLSSNTTSRETPTIQSTTDTVLQYIQSQNENISSIIAPFQESSQAFLQHEKDIAAVKASELAEYIKHQNENFLRNVKPFSDNAGANLSDVVHFDQIDISNSDGRVKEFIQFLQSRNQEFIDRLSADIEHEESSQQKNINEIMQYIKSHQEFLQSSVNAYLKRATSNENQTKESQSASMTASSGPIQNVFDYIQSLNAPLFTSPFASVHEK